MERIVAESLIQQLRAKLGIQSLNKDDQFPLRIAMDNGVEGIADPADVFVNKNTGEILPGHAEEVAKILKERAGLWKPSTRNYWLTRIGRFWNGKNTARPMIEGKNFRRSPVEIYLTY